MCNISKQAQKIQQKPFKNYLPAEVLKNKLLMKCSLMFTSLSSSSSDLSEASMDVQNRLMNQLKLQETKKDIFWIVWKYRKCLKGINYCIHSQIFYLPELVHVIDARQVISSKV